MDRTLLEETLHLAADRLLSARNEQGHWRGRLSSSALSTATSVFALAAVDEPGHRELTRRGLDWLAAHATADGGWGDTTVSRSNLSTTLLAWSAFSVAGDPGPYADTAARAQTYIAAAAGGLDGARIASAITTDYGAARTFSVPILTMCVLAGRLGADPDAWRHVAQLPFELAIFPGRWLKLLRLQVVSYALPALVAVGLVRCRRRPPRNPLTRCVRALARRRALKVLAAIQPAGGGFLEAAPLTGFVAMSLVGAGLGDHPVVGECVEFLVRSAREDGSWPIDTDLATWVTTLSVNALSGGGLLETLPDAQRRRLREWLLARQCRTVHPYTGAAPGGWAWTDLPGGVPDADDTAGALLALRNLGPLDDRAVEAARAGVGWLAGLQNRDGGIPTFCRGWGKLPFDRSSPDLTAHALAACRAWREHLTGRLARRCDRGMARMLEFLSATQRGDGAWLPLWFGNESAPAWGNPTYGTARVVLGLAGADEGAAPTAGMIARGAGWLVRARNDDGGWGGAPGVPSSVEETALAVDALAAAGMPGPDARAAIEAGLEWLVGRVRGEAPSPTPIGLYFARLWYFERLYPLVFTVSALGRAARLPE